MKIQTIKHMIIYFLVFIMIIGLTSTFIAKEFIGQAKEISLMGEDMLQMQVSLNNANISKGQNHAQDSTPIDNIEEIIIEDHREVFEIGDTHEKIKEYQEALVQLEYLHSKPDGAFGPMTLEAVKSFQTEENIEATGKLDIETQKLLENAQQKEHNKLEQQNSNSENEKKNTEHIIKENETLSKISEQYDVSLEDIYQTNNLTESSTIRIGQKIIIPSN